MKFQFDYPMEKGQCGDCPMFRDHDDWYECVLDGGQTTPSGCLPDECPLEEAEVMHPYPKEKPTEEKLYLVSIHSEHIGDRVDIDYWNGNKWTDFGSMVYAWKKLPQPAWRFNAQES